MKVERILRDQTGTINSKMVAAKPEIHISKLIISLVSVYFAQILTKFTVYTIALLQVV